MVFLLLISTNERQLEKEFNSQNEIPFKLVFILNFRLIFVYFFIVNSYFTFSLAEKYKDIVLEKMFYTGSINVL